MSNLKKNNNVNEVKNDNLVFVAEKPWLSVKEFAAYTGYKVSYVYKLISERRVACYKRDGGKNVLFKKDEVDSWILGHRIAPMEELEEEAVRYVAKNSIEDVVFRPSRRVIDDDDEEKPKKKAATTSKKKLSTKAKAKDEPTPKDKKGAKKPSTKKSKAIEESSKKGKKEVKKTSTKRKPTTKKKKR